MLDGRVKRLLRWPTRSYEVYNRIEVSRSALLHNARFFADITGMQVIPVLKGNAYGHGIEQVATALKPEKFPYIAVDGYFEALKVRACNPRQSVLVMGMIKPQNFARLKVRGLAFLAQDEDTVRSLGALRQRIKIHLDINTGMNRYGIRPDELDHYLDLIKSFPNLHLEGIMSHLADADGDNNQTMTAAVSLFDECVEKVLASGAKPTLFHIAQSAGSMRVQSRYANAIRIGLGLYGINPFPANHPMYNQCKGLRPALQLIGTISKIQQLQKGDKVSYNYTFTAPKPMRIGVLPLGYHEGVPRELSNRGTVKSGQYVLPIVGRICMNHTVIDVNSTDLQTGSEVMVYSSNPDDPNSIESLARQHGLFPYSLLTGLSPDVRRFLID